MQCQLQGVVSSQLCSRSPQEHVKQEKHLMAECDCVFLVRLVAGFQDAAYLYMVLEAAMGGEFFLYMQVLCKGSLNPQGRRHCMHTKRR